MKRIEFITLSQLQAETLTSKDIAKYKKPVMISITSPVEKPASIKVNIPILRLQFDDIDKHEEALKEITNYPFFPFEHSMPHQILEFINKKEPDLIITHCKAGVCRSAAVNAALSHIMNNEDDIFFKERVPNMLVYTSILNYWFIDLFESYDKKPNKSAKHLYPWIYKVRYKLLPRLN